MGMKSAACWFAQRWHVRTSALGESTVRTVRFDIKNIVDDGIEELEIEEEMEEADHHFTEIVLEDVFHIPISRTVGKLKEHLTDIYRIFIREKTLTLRLKGEILEPEEPSVLKAPWFRDKDGEDKIWRKDIAFDFGDGMSVNGFAALREKANTSRAGFSLFRRNRLIEGSGDEGYRPSLIFGTSNSYRYQRLFGELHLEGFEVSHTKDGFRWNEDEVPFLEILSDHLDSEELPLLKQAEGYRVRAQRKEYEIPAKAAVDNTVRVISENLPSVLPKLASAPPVDTPEEESPHIATVAGKQFDVDYRGQKWRISIELTEDLAESQWLVINDIKKSDENSRLLDVRVSMVHPFMIRFAQANAESVEALLRVAAALALAEVLARDAGIQRAGTVRRNVNDIIREALSEA